MKYVVLGTSVFTMQCTQALLDTNQEVSALVSMPESVLPNNSIDLKSFAKEKSISFHEIEDINSTVSVELLKTYKPDYIFSSWPKILGNEVLSIARFFCIGTHPTALPYNRGRHPLHWMIVLGIRKSRLSFFRMDEGVDTGDLLLQIPFKIASNYSINETVANMNDAAYKGTRLLCKQLKKELYNSVVKQNHEIANYWRKRTCHDVILDLRMSSNMILKTVLSFAPPYPCALLIFEKHILRIENASLARTEIMPEGVRRIEHGRIIDIVKQKICVKVEDGIVELDCKDLIPQEMLQAKYIHPPTKYLAKWPQLWDYFV